ncbi:MAG: hypothetical protein M3466_15835 [Gemmatimonadota bacterium]|nr:hypothetical protein [Gemmatimonadota bacterium]
MDFPLDLRFKTIALAPQISVTEPSGGIVAYVRQKAFKLKEAVTVFGDVAQTRALYRIAADRVFDISAKYHIEDVGGSPLGVLQRQGMRSFWKAHYEIHRGGQPLFVVREENPWIKIIDGVLGEIPVVGLLAGYAFHPAYRVTRVGSDTPMLRLIKRPALFEGRYTIERLTVLSQDEELLMVLGLLMLVLLERSRG